MNHKVLKSCMIVPICFSLFGCQDNNSKDEKNTDAVKQENSHEHNHKDEHNHHHGHAMTKEEKNIYKGYFKDEQVKDRPLTDWEGDWQSVYPYLKDGTLDEVFVQKAKEDDSKTANQYKKYYNTGYKTDISRINIGEKMISFYKGKQKSTAEYSYDGKEILKYEAGNRGVRFIFKKVKGDDEAPKFIQFSDHIIAPEKALHYHIYMGNDRAALLKEMEHWPTYYPSDMDGKTIKEEMMAH